MKSLVVELLGDRLALVRPAVQTSASFASISSLSRRAIVLLRAYRVASPFLDRDALRARPGRQRRRGHPRVRLSARGVRRSPHLTRSVIEEGLSAAEIDAAVRERTRGRPGALRARRARCSRELEPDLIVTQAVCEVCAVSYDDVVAAAGRLPSRPKVLSLDPTTLGEVLADIPRLAEAAGVAGGGRGAGRGGRPAHRRRGATRSTAPSARGWPRSSGSTPCSSAGTGCRR